MQLSPQQKADFAQAGYLCLKGVFRADEIAALHRIATDLRDEPIALRFLYAYPEFRNWWQDPRLLGIARSILGEELVFFFDYHIHRYLFEPGAPILGRHLHHDAKGTSENLFNRLNTPAVRSEEHTSELQSH